MTRRLRSRWPWQLTTEGLLNDIRASHGFLRETAGTPTSSASVIAWEAGFRFLATHRSQCAPRFLTTVADPPTVSSTAPPTAPRPCCSSGEKKTSTSPANIARRSRRECTPSKHSSVQVTFSDADHGFFCDQRPSYNPTAAELSWDLTLSYFEQYLYLF